MSNLTEPATLVVVSDSEYALSGRKVWGSGGWVPPSEREGLDWLTFIRLLGWSVDVVKVNDVSALVKRLSPAIARVIIACDPNVITRDFISVIARHLESTTTILVTRAGSPSCPIAGLSRVERKSDIASGRQFQWTGNGESVSWLLRSPIEVTILGCTGETSVLVKMGDKPVVALRKVSLGVVATLAFHPSEARDNGGAATKLLKHVLIYGFSKPTAWLDLESTLVMRMDDPGASQNVLQKSWSYPQMRLAQWNAIISELNRHQARLSVAYVPGWVDDGNPTRGTLTVDGRDIKRTPGAIYPSHRVRYEDHRGHMPGTVHDYREQYIGIQALRRAGLGDVELHGYTHMHPDTSAWSKAFDRYDNTKWYREFRENGGATESGGSASAGRIRLGCNSLREFFGSSPTTLIPPGDEWTDDVLEAALDAGIVFFDSYYLAITWNNRFCWTTHICSPYLDEPHNKWFESGLPTVGYFHDREPALLGANWFSECLGKWRAAGARRFIDFRELATVLGLSVQWDARRQELRLRQNEPSPESFVKPLSIYLRVPEGDRPNLKFANFNGGRIDCEYSRTSESDIYRIVLDPKEFARANRHCVQ